MKYILSSGLASIEFDHTLGEKEYTLPVKRKEVDLALRESLENLAIMQSRITQVELEHKNLTDELVELRGENVALGIKMGTF